MVTRVSALTVGGFSRKGGDNYGYILGYVFIR